MKKLSNVNEGSLWSSVVNRDISGGSRLEDKTNIDEINPVDFSRTMLKFYVADRYLVIGNRDKFEYKEVSGDHPEFNGWRLMTPKEVDAWAIMCHFILKPNNVMEIKKWGSGHEIEISLETDDGDVESWVEGGDGYVFKAGDEENSLTNPGVYFTKKKEYRALLVKDKDYERQ